MKKEKKKALKKRIKRCSIPKLGIAKTKIDISQELLLRRQVFLFGPIEAQLTHKIIQRLLFLESLSVTKSDIITLWINSPGGSVIGGLSILDVIKSLKSKVVTVVTGEASSIAGVISVCGYRRLMTKNSIWMSHDIYGGIGYDSASKNIARADGLLKWTQSTVFKILRENTKLTEGELTKARHRELWIPAAECKQKGIIDMLLE